MTTPHTPGPWYKASTGNHQGLIISEATGENIAVAYDKKDAPLIAAAPDLLAVLKILEARITRAAKAFYVSGKRADLQEALHGWRVDALEARSAISKAEGQA